MYKNAQADDNAQTDQKNAILPMCCELYQLVVNCQPHQVPTSLSENQTC